VAAVGIFGFEIKVSRISPARLARAFHNQLVNRPQRQNYEWKRRCFQKLGFQPGFDLADGLQLYGPGSQDLKKQLGRL